MTKADQILGLRERKKLEVKRRILTTATSLFRTKGYTQTSMDEIAEKAEISRKSLFNYMSSKESILVALVDELVRINIPDWTEDVAPYNHKVQDAIAPNLTKKLNAIAQNRWLLTMVAQHTGYYNAVKSRFVDNALLSNYYSRVKRIAAMQQEGNIRKDISPEEISTYYESLRDLTIQRWLLATDSSKQELHQSFDNTMKILIQGLAP